MLSNQLVVISLNELYQKKLKIDFWPFLLQSEAFFLLVLAIKVFITTKKIFSINIIIMHKGSNVELCKFELFYLTTFLGKITWKKNNILVFLVFFFRWAFCFYLSSAVNFSVYELDRHLFVTMLEIYNVG